MCGGAWAPQPARAGRRRGLRSVVCGGVIMLGRVRALGMSRRRMEGADWESWRGMKKNLAVKVIVLMLMMCDDQV